MASSFHLGEWLVEPSLNRLSRGDETRRIEPRLMDLLVYLADRASHVVPKHELIDAVWARRYVAESALSRAVAGLRRALDDDARSPRYIETVARRGLRVIAAVIPVEMDATGSVSVVESGTRAAICELVTGGRVLPLGIGEHLLGRQPSAAVRLEGAEASRRHARLLVTPARVTIEDLGSKNGTFVGGRRVEGATELHDGTEICVGTDVFTFRWAVRLATTATNDAAREEQPDGRQQ